MNRHNLFVSAGMGLRIGLRIGIGALAASAGVARAQTALTQAAASPPPLHSTVFRRDSARGTLRAAASRSIVDTVTAALAKLEMHETTLQPGQSPHPPHRHAHEELMIVRSGTIEALQGNVTRTAGPGSVVYMASNELHGLRNTGTQPATYLVIRIDPHDLPPDAPLSDLDQAARAWTDSARLIVHPRAGGGRGGMRK